MSRLVPVNYFGSGFFERQKALFPKFQSEFEKSFDDFEKEMQKMRRELFRLSPWDAGRDPFDLAHWGLQDVIQYEKPFVEDISGNKKLNLKFDCSRFKPEEITVKTTDRNLIVHAKHEESNPGEKVYREFTRSYVLPENVDPSALTSSLSSDGVLCIEAPAPKDVPARKESLVPTERLAIQS
uniref:Body wall muscle protein HR-29-like n=1 Tax=Crassostrea virginica TaxID=6565 RepID=A0A8B8B4J7_CRAVI|nr:body wall muscle protein HR-29-like [Crassostrea virginica]